MVPLLVGFGVWLAGGDRVTQLRLLTHADEPDAMEPPIIEECFTEKLGSGLKSLCYLRQPGESVVSGCLKNYAWRSEQLETAVRMFTSCPDLSRLQRTMPDIEALTQVISFVPRQAAQPRVWRCDSRVMTQPEIARSIGTSAVMLIAGFATRAERADLH
jgi:hypothetical protein